MQVWLTVHHQVSAPSREQWGSNDMLPHSTHVRCGWWIKTPFNASALQILFSAILIQVRNSLTKFTGCIPFAVASVRLAYSPDLPPAALGFERLQTSTAAGSVVSLPWLPRKALAFEPLWTSPTDCFVASLSSLSASPQVGSEWLRSSSTDTWGLLIHSRQVSVTLVVGHRLCWMMVTYLVNRQQTLPLLASSAHPSFWASLPHGVFIVIIRQTRADDMAQLKIEARSDVLLQIQRWRPMTSLVSQCSQQLTCSEMRWCVGVLACVRSWNCCCCIIPPVWPVGVAISQGWRIPQ